MNIKAVFWCELLLFGFASTQDAAMNEMFRGAIDEWQNSRIRCYTFEVTELFNHFVVDWCPGRSQSYKVHVNDSVVTDVLDLSNCPLDPNDDNPDKWRWRYDMGGLLYDLFSYSEMVPANGHINIWRYSPDNIFSVEANLFFDDPQDVDEEYHIVVENFVVVEDCPDTSMNNIYQTQIDWGLAGIECYSYQITELENYWVDQNCGWPQSYFVRVVRSNVTEVVDLTCHMDVNLYDPWWGPFEMTSLLDAMESYLTPENIVGEIMFFGGIFEADLRFDDPQLVDEESHVIIDNFELETCPDITDCELWQAGIGDAYFLGYACGKSTGYFTLLSAKEQCCSCPECSGVTQKGERYYTRSGMYLLSSRHDETSWRRGTLNSECGFSLPIPGYLRDYACDDRRSFATVEDAQHACCSCEECGGVTCNSEGICQMRKEMFARKSPTDEQSFIKKPTNTEPECIYSTALQTTYLAGYACTPQRYQSLVEAQRACCLCDQCSGVTSGFEKGELIYTTRAGETRGAPTGPIIPSERSWLKESATVRYDCIGPYACANRTINCPQFRPSYCHVYCSGAHACDGATINGSPEQFPNSEYGRMFVDCSASSTSCFNTEINCPGTDDGCSVQCRDGCTQAQTFCEYSCDVECWSGACDGSTVYCAPFHQCWVDADAGENLTVTDVWP